MFFMGDYYLKCSHLYSDAGHPKIVEKCLWLHNYEELPQFLFIFVEYGYILPIDSLIYFYG